jgi:3-oxoacyl-[acyl-carrier protein] reductase
MGTMTNKVAVVTGASKGLGAGIAKKLAAEGASVVVNYNSDKDGAERTVAEIIKNGGKAIAVKANVASEADAKALIDATVKAYGPVDVLVNNSGIYEFAELNDITVDHYRNQFDINVLGLLLVTQAAARQFNPKGGAVVNISSGVSTIAMPSAAVYAATKASVDVIGIVLSKELAAKNIRVNTVNPGMVVTEGVKSAGVIEAGFDKMVIASTPLARLGEVHEIADAVAFFASDAASYVTGETLHVTGGWR